MRRLFQLTQLGANVHVIDTIPDDPARPPRIDAPQIVPAVTVLQGDGYNVVTASGMPRPAVPLVTPPSR